jgi:Tfp pilus assembly protein PilO
MSVLGNVNQIKSFLSALAGLPRTLVVNTVSMSGSTAAISAQIFYAGQPTP